MQILSFNKQLAIKLSRFKKITIANPKLAPYGNATHEFLQTLKLDKKVRRIIMVKISIKL